MDTFGVGAQARGALMTVFTAGRATGRTTAMIESLHSGDRVVCTNHREAARVKHLAKALGREVEVLAIPVDEARRLHERGTAQGRLVFDHGWLEAFYLQAVDDAYTWIEGARQSLSGGFDHRHVETRRVAIEAQKWGWQEPGKGGA